MSITIIKGATKSGKSLIANALRNNQISNKHGALLIDEKSEGELDHLIEKIIVGVTMPSDTKNWQETLPFKPNSMIILVGDQESKLAEIEARLPGFTEKFGPVYTIDTAVG